ncbi:E3 ubiquitin-protein ligase RNF183 [Salarias fasciatus]|uniref:RING finger protein 225-like n=1 Tax=Salarias fasciatus TaxID=181472 RepID=A0A672G3W0_SALFA|nr:RING finger protein 225-like [Salarias fasciatus]
MSGEGSGRRPLSSVPQNVKPKMNEKGAGLRAAPRSRSISPEQRGRRRERQRAERRRRGRSEEARGRHGKRAASERRPAAGEGAEPEECAVCFCSYDNVFKAPKLLACGHTFCLECLARINVTSPDLTAVSCPVCREPTRLPHGRDLPRLGTNHDIIGRLPPGMRRALSVRFKRSKGKLLLKDPPPPGGAAAAELPVKNPPGAGGVVAGLAGDSGTGAPEDGGPPPTVVDVGRPPGRVRGRLRRLLRSDRCYYAVVGSIITITVTLMLVGILAFIIIPRVPGPPRPPPQNNQTGPT